MTCNLCEGEEIWVKHLATLAVSIVVLLALLFVADSLIERRPFFGRAFWALVDSAVHGLVARLVTAPIIQSVSTTQQRLALSVLAFLTGTLVDVDHFLGSRSRSFWTATHLEKRPPTHSVTFAPRRGWVPPLREPRVWLGGPCSVHLARPARCISGYCAAPVATGRLEDIEVGLLSRGTRAGSGGVLVAEWDRLASA